MGELLANLSESLAATVEAAGKGCVQVDARRRLPASGILWSADGIVVTAHHVVEREESIKVGLPDGDDVPAALVDRDPSTDLAVLRIDSPGLKEAVRADTKSLRVGHLVLALGRPTGDIRATLGVASALGGGRDASSEGRLDFYVQTDVVMYPGFSGGPLVDVESRVLGLNTSALARGLSLAVPVDTIERVVKSILTHGRIRRGYLGIGAQPVSLPEALAKNLGQESGLLLVSVEEGSPADQGGLALGDTILAIDGQPVRQIDELRGLLGGERIGTRVKLRYLRGGRAQETEVTVGERS